MSEKQERIVKRSGVLELTPEVKIPCYILEDGTRVLSGRGMQDALKMIDDDNANTGQKSGARLQRYLNQKTLKQFIYSGKEPGHYDALECYHGKSKISGYEATILVDLCDAFMEARKNIDLSPRQKIIADQCEILIRSFAKVGIIALIDEATGYQYEREKKELQVIFKAFISDEILKWQEAFHLSFYKEIFRLWNIPFTDKYIKRKPQFLGHITNRYVYQNMPKGIFVLDKLKEKTPRTSKGDFKYRLHQSLTKDQGREALKKVIYSVEALASIAKDKNDFIRLIEEKYGQKEIPFEDLDRLDEPKKEAPNTDFNNVLKGMLSVPKQDEKDDDNGPDKNKKRGRKKKGDK